MFQRKPPDTSAQYLQWDPLNKDLLPCRGDAHNRNRKIYDVITLPLLNSC